MESIFELFVSKASDELENVLFIARDWNTPFHSVQNAPKSSTWEEEKKN